MPDDVTRTERTLIDEALAASKARTIPRGVSGLEEVPMYGGHPTRSMMHGAKVVRARAAKATVRSEVRGLQRLGRIGKRR